jgi:hypothetical protein
MNNIAAFVSSYADLKAGARTLFVDPASLPALPPTLALASGLTTQCSGEFQVTNTSTQTIQLVRVGVELNSAPTPNTFSYRLIDACPFLYADPKMRFEECPPPLGAGVACSYSAQVTLVTIDAGIKGAQSSAPIQGFDPHLPSEAPCPQLTLDPHQEVTVVAIFVPPAAGNSSLVYDVTPYLTIAGSQGSQDISLPHLRSTLIFSTQSQSACYQPTGDTFAIPDPQATSPAYPGFAQKLFCI